MAYSSRLDRSKLQMVKRQLGHMIGHFHRDVIDGKEAELHETFELCMIQGDVFPLGKNARLSTIVKRTGSWQHLIKSNGTAIGLAHSAAPGPLESTWSIQNFFVSPISAKIAVAVEKIDKTRAEDDIEVVLVTVPSKMVDFFLLRSPKKTEVYLIVGRDKSTGLIESRFYTETRFLKLLSSVPKVTGLRAIGSSNDSMESLRKEKTPG